MLVDVMLKLLGDEDQRVRHAAASAICRFESKHDYCIASNTPYSRRTDCLSF